VSGPAVVRASGDTDERPLDHWFATSLLAREAVV